MNWLPQHTFVLHGTGGQGKCRHGGVCKYYFLHLSIAVIGRIYISEKLILGMYRVNDKNILCNFYPTPHSIGHGQ